MNRGPTSLGRDQEDDRSLASGIHRFGCHGIFRGKCTRGGSCNACRLTWRSCGARYTLEVLEAMRSPRMCGQVPALIFGMAGGRSCFDRRRSRIVSGKNAKIRPWKRRNAENTKGRCFPRFLGKRFAVSHFSTGRRLLNSLRCLHRLLRGTLKWDVVVGDLGGLHQIVGGGRRTLVVGGTGAGRCG